MFTFPIVRSLDKLPAYFASIAMQQVPTKFTHRFFSDVCGFTSSQDRDFVKVLKFLKFISADGTPAEDYVSLRDTAGFTSALYSHIHTSYTTLFVSDDVSHDSLVAEILKQTSVSRMVASVCADTLLALLALAGHSIDALSASPASVSSTLSKSVANSAVSITLNLPTTTDKLVYNNLFEALFKYLKNSR